MGIGSNLWSWHRAQATRQAEQAAADHVDPVVDDLVLVVEEPAADRQEAHRGQRAGVASQVELVGGDLLDARTGRRAGRALKARIT